MKLRIMAVFIGIVLLSLAGCKKDGVSLITTSLRTKPTAQKGNFKWGKRLNRGQIVKIIEKQSDGEWVKVRLADGKSEGWVQKRFVHEGKKEIIEFSSQAKLHDQPDSESKVKANLPMGSKALVLEKREQWYNVSISYHLNGWVKKGSFTQSSDIKEEKKLHEVYISGIGKCMIESSSTLADSGGYSYSVNNLFDKNPGTTWQEGKDGSGIGEWVEITFPEATTVSVSMINGFVKKDEKYAKYGEEGDLYLLNNRLKGMKVEYWDWDDVKQSSSVSFEDDVRQYQDAGVYENVRKIRFIIDSVYKGAKWPDTCIGEIRMEKTVVQ